MKKIIYIIIHAVFILSISISDAQWFALATNTTENLQDIYFINSSTGVAVGNNGKIIRTTDAGLTWQSITSGTGNSLFSLKFPDNITGYTGGYTGTVLRTLNSGASWSPRTGCGINISCISFLNTSTGITAGGGSLMCFTTDGGQSWNPRYTPGYIVMSISFINLTTLIACAVDMPGAKIFKSTNNGNNWSEVMTLNNSGLNQTYSLSYIYFKNAVTGFCTGSHTFNGPVWGDIYRTTNAGNNWSAAGSIGPATGSALFGISFGDSLSGTAVGNNGVIMRSTNGGANWFVQAGASTNTLKAVHMLNSLTGYICGNNGLILKTTNGGFTGITTSGNVIPESYLLYQNFPNPFNPSTKIKFDVPADGKRQTANVKLDIYDVLGRKITSLIPPLRGGQEGLRPGTYEVEWHAGDYSSGVYLYKLTAGDFIESKRMVLLK